MKTLDIEQIKRESRENMIRLWTEKAKRLEQEIALTGEKSDAKTVLNWVDATMHMTDLYNFFDAISDKIKQLEQAEKWYTDQKFATPQGLVRLRAVLEKQSQQN